MSIVFRDAVVAGATVRPARRDETEAVIGFYQSSSDPFLLPRPADDFRQAVQRGQHFLVHRDGELVAASGVFDYDANRPFVELSETLVLPPLRGYRLQSLFFRLRVASVVLTQGPGVEITTAIDPANTASLASMKKQGFVPWASAIPEAYASCPTCRNREAAMNAGRQCCCDFYVLPVEQARARVRELLDDSIHGFVDLDGRAGWLRVDCSGSRVVADDDYRAMLHDFADGATW